MFNIFKSKRPSNIITDLEFSAEVLLIMRSGKILMTSDSLADKEKDQLDGAVFEIMVKMRVGAPFFVYYKCDEYYLLAQQQASILDAFKGPEWRTAISEKILAFLAKYISYSLKENIGPLMVSYHHNAKHTNVLAYIEKLDEWYPIRHNDNESEDITELRVSDVNRGIADVSKFVAISDLSPTVSDASMATNRPIKEKKSTEIPDYESGKELFELGVAEAQKADFAMAFEYYSKSIEACANPVPYLNRARILFKRLRYQEGLQDLLEAKRLDLAQGNEFGEELDSEINAAEFYTRNYTNGTRKKLLDDFKINDVLYIARRILCTSFKVELTGYGGYNSPLVEFHFFNELDNVKRFEDLGVYPEVEEFLRDYPDDFIQMKIEANPNPLAYKNAEMLLHNFLCTYDEKEMRYIRRNIIYDIHSRLMDDDYGALGQGMGSDCPRVTKEAHEYIMGRT